VGGGNHGRDNLVRPSEGHQVPSLGGLRGRMGRHPAPGSSDPTETLDHVFRQVADKNGGGGAGAGLLFISPLEKHLRYVLRLHFPASNNVAEYEALVNGLRIAIELGVRRLDARGDPQLVIDQVMKNSHYRDPKMEAYCDEVRRLEDKFYGLEVNHVARRYNETADELAKIASA
jgi:ribonuclease HI